LGCGPENLAELKAAQRRWTSSRAQQHRSDAALFTWGAAAKARHVDARLINEVSGFRLELVGSATYV